MSGQDLRKIMNLMESVEETVEVTETEELDEGIQGMDLDALLWQLFEYGSKYSTVSPNGPIYNKASGLVDQIISQYGNTVGAMAEDVVMETGNANAQQKGINFNGTKAAKGDGVLPRKGPKAKTAGNSAPLATTKSATNVGNIKS